MPRSVEDWLAFVKELRDAAADPSTPTGLSVLLGRAACDIEGFLARSGINVGPAFRDIVREHNLRPSVDVSAA